MKIINTFAVIEDSIYAIQFEHENEFTHAWAKCFELWNDPIYLNDFFEEHEDDLYDPFWSGITIEEAIIKTRQDAVLLEKKLKDIAESGKYKGNDNLSSFFEPLSKGRIEDYEKDKAKGIINPSWLRIYAIRIDANCFVITGGGIKLTKTMNDRQHLLDELDKLEFTRNELLDGGNETLDIVEFR
ncbi:MAG: hypothetical protein Q8S44_09000 [Flavobacteriaceae bacterium]|nr:hypothetical protein [Flavobacteriaceae bacterium]